MNKRFSKTLKKLRSERGLSQQELADLIHVTRPTVARWETGTRLPDAEMISTLAHTLRVDVNTLLNEAESDGSLNVIIVDDRKIILTGGIPVLQEVLPNAVISGFTSPSEAIKYAENNKIALAFLDIELGKTSGLDLCRALLEIEPLTNVVFLTAYSGYSLDAWNTGASGFMLKPITAEGVREQLNNLRHPFLQNFQEVTPDD